MMSRASWRSEAPFMPRFIADWRIIYRLVFSGRYVSGTLRDRTRIQAYLQHFLRAVSQKQGF
jgi:hypothetical protein